MNSLDRTTLRPRRRVTPPPAVAASSPEALKRLADQLAAGETISARHLLCLASSLDLANAADLAGCILATSDLTKMPEALLAELHGVILAERELRARC